MNGLVCPVHGVPFAKSHPKPGKPDSYYCTKFVGVGQPGTNQKGYCDQRYIPAQQAAPVPAAAPVVAAAAPARDGRGDAAIAAAALQFAKDMYAVNPQDFGDFNDVINLAARAFNAMKAVMG